MSRGLCNECCCTSWEHLYRDMRCDRCLHGGAAAAVPERADRAGDSQGLPTVNSEQDIQSRVIADIEKRREVGISRYGTALQPHNGRDALLDLYEELLDAAMYVKQRLVEEHDERGL